MEDLKKKVEKMARGEKESGIPKGISRDIEY
jgi:hypothetical protein